MKEPLSRIFRERKLRPKNWLEGKLESIWSLEVKDVNRCGSLETNKKDATNYSQQNETLLSLVTYNHKTKYNYNEYTTEHVESYIYKTVFYLLYK
jgi:hypothetical protein